MHDSRKRIVVDRILTQEDFDRFATLSGDDNPIHVDPRFSATTRFGRTVAHGLLLNAILRGLLGQLMPGGRQESQTLKFPAPTFAADTMRFAAEISSDDGQRVTATMSVTRVRDQVTTCEGNTTMRRGANLPWS